MKDCPNPERNETSIDPVALKLAIGAFEYQNAIDEGLAFSDAIASAIRAYLVASSPEHLAAAIRVYLEARWKPLPSDCTAIPSPADERRQP